MLVEVFIVISLIAVVWLGFLTFYLLRINANFRFFTHGVHKKTLDAVLNNMIKEINGTKKEVGDLISRCDTIEKNELSHIQKIGLLRFNPFNDTGGDQSFILSLVDAHDSGVVITALYSRSGTRWYAKRVVKGKGLEHDLSEEEKKTLSMSKTIHTADSAQEGKTAAL